MNIMFILDDNEHCTNIGIAKALTEAELSHNDLKEIVGYLSVFLYNHDPIIEDYNTIEKKYTEGS